MLIAQEMGRSRRHGSEDPPLRLTHKLLGRQVEVAFGAGNYRVEFRGAAFDELGLEAELRRGFAESSGFWSA